MFFSCLSVLCVWGNDPLMMPGTSPHMSRSSTESDPEVGVDQKPNLENLLATLPLHYDDPTALEQLKKHALTEPANPQAIDALIAVLKASTDSENTDAQRAIERLQQKISKKDSRTTSRIELWTALDQDCDALMRVGKADDIRAFCTKIETALSKQSINKTKAFSLLTKCYTALGNMAKANEYAEKLEAAYGNLTTYIAKLITEINQSQ